MNKPYEVKNGNNMPIQIPLYDDPFVPYHVDDMPTLSVYCRAAPGIVEKYLQPTPFEFVSSDFVVSIANYTTEHYMGGFYDMALVVPVKYKDMYGGHFLFEYEQDDYCVAAGREIWGYPKKLAAGTLVEESGRVIATATKDGVEVMRLEIDLQAAPQGKIPAIKTAPHLNIHCIPNCDGPGIFSKRIISRDTSPDYVSKKRVEGFGRLSLASTRNNPIGEFTPEEIYGAVFEIGDYKATPENGWGKLLETLI